MDEPFDCAMETAQIVSDVFGIGEVIGFGFIGEGYFGGFQTRSRSWIREAPVVLVVGHEPFMGGWAETLSGRILPFKRARRRVF
jgi:phosphohistidine phosphatase SixA